MKLNYLSAEEILRLHFQLIEDYGGSHGVRDESRLKSIIVAPKQHVFGQEQYPTLYEKAAVYLRNIVGDHPFIDGNKPTAVTVCGLFLGRNDVALIVSHKDLESFMVRVATDHLSIEVIAEWLRANSKVTLQGIRNSKPK
jgi:death-on-curing protein